MVTSVTLLLLWVVARGDRLLDPDIPRAYLNYTTARLLIIPIGILASIGVAFSNVLIAEGVVFCAFMVSWTARGIFHRQHPFVGYMDGTIRICSITDNMTAVAITFLVASIVGTLLSESTQPFSTALATVLKVVPEFSFSVLIVGFYWLSHHGIYQVIRRHNMTLIWLNFAFLLFIEL